MKLIVATFIFLSSVVVHAGLAGDWTGFGKWTFKGEGDGVRCSPMTMKWSETKNTIAIESGFFDCEFVAMHVYKTEWTIIDGKLLDADQKEVGSYNGTEFQVYMPSPNEKTTIAISAKREANHYDYQEVWFNEFEKVYVIQARFFTGGR